MALLRKRRAFAFKSFLSALLLGIVSIVVFESFKGSHPECSVNDSVGPCELSGRVIFDLPLVLYQTILYWIIILLVEWLSGLARKRIKVKL